MAPNILFYPKSIRCVCYCFSIQYTVICFGKFTHCDKIIRIFSVKMFVLINEIMYKYSFYHLPQETHCV